MFFCFVCFVFFTEKLFHHKFTVFFCTVVQSKFIMNGTQCYIKPKQNSKERKCHPCSLNYSYTRSDVLPLHSYKEYSESEVFTGKTSTNIHSLGLTTNIQSPGLTNNRSRLEISPLCKSQDTTCKTISRGFGRCRDSIQIASGFYRRNCEPHILVHLSIQGRAKK